MCIRDRAYQKSLDEEAAMSQHARRRLYDEYLVAWDEERTAISAVDLEITELNKLRDDYLAQVGGERSALLAVLRAENNHKVNSAAATRLTQRAEDERQSILAYVVERAGGDETILNDIAERGLDSPHVRELLNDNIRLDNYASIVSSADEAAAYSTAALEARVAAKAALDLSLIHISEPTRPY